MRNPVYELDVPGAIFALEVAGMSAPDWMRHSRLPSRLFLRPGRHALAMDMDEDQLPVGLADEIYRAHAGQRRPVGDPPMGFRMDSVLFFSARGALREVSHAPA